MPAPSRALEQPVSERERLIAECIIAVACPICRAEPRKICMPRSKAGTKRTAFAGRTHQARDKAGMKLYHERYGSPLAVTKEQ